MEKFKINTKDVSFVGIILLALLLLGVIFFLFNSFKEQSESPFPQGEDFNEVLNSMGGEEGANDSFFEELESVDSSTGGAFFDSNTAQTVAAGTSSPDCTEDPTISLRLNAREFQRGDTLTLGATLANNGCMTPVDIYLAIKTPEGNLHFYPTWTKEPTPVKSMWVVPDWSGDVFTVALENPLPVGVYTFQAAFLIPGTNTVLGTVERLSFTFSALEPIVPGDYEESITVDGFDRTYLLHIPLGFEAAIQYPLVLVLSASKATSIANISQFSRVADENGFIVAYPENIYGAWAFGLGTTDAEINGVDDVNFIRTLVGRLFAEFNINKDSIFAVGNSNGGMMAYRLGCELPHIFGAVASVAGNIAEPLRDTCSPQQTSLVTVFGTDDQSVPFEGGVLPKHPDLGSVLSTADSLRIYSKANGCSTNPKIEFLPILVDDGTEVEKQTFTPCTSGAEVIGYIIHGGGHKWPPVQGTGGTLDSGISSQNLDATEVIWELFERIIKR